MNILIVGGKYHARHRKTGFSDKGPWELYSVVDDKDRNEITIFVTNPKMPTNMPNTGGDFILKNIKNVKNGARQSTQGVWFQNVTIEAEVEYIEPDKSFDEVEEGNPWENMPAEEERPPWEGMEAEVDAGELPF